MSTKINTTRTAALSYNEKAALSVGWGGKIPPLVLDIYPSLREGHDTEGFFQGVLRLQQDLFQDPALVDGKFGRGTWEAVCKKYTPVGSRENYWLVSGQRVSIDSDVRFINCDEKEGLDLHRIGHFSSRGKITPKILVLHWGGLNPQHCFQVFSDPHRKVSSHAGIGKNSEGEVGVYQYLDLSHKAWHGGWINPYSVGIDICQQPNTSWESHYLKQGYKVQVTKNPTQRGDRNILSLDPYIAHATKEAIKTICSIYEIPLRCPRGILGQDTQGTIYHGVVDELFLRNEFSGVIGHHHVSGNKWDIACWWDAIWEEDWR